jgi:hypothetical protein
MKTIKRTIEKKNKKVKGKKKLERIAHQQAFNKMPDSKGSEKPLRKAAKFQKLSDETENSFLNRIERVCDPCLAFLFRQIFIK